MGEKFNAKTIRPDIHIGVLQKSLGFIFLLKKDLLIWLIITAWQYLTSSSSDQKLKA